MRFPIAFAASCLILSSCLLATPADAQSRGEGGGQENRTTATAPDTSQTKRIDAPGQTLGGVRGSFGGASFGGSAEARFIMVSTADQSHVGWRRSFQLGLFLEAPSPARLRYRAEVTYACKGGYQEVEIGGLNELTYTTHNLQAVPLMLRLHAHPETQPYAGLFGSVILAESGTRVTNTTRKYSDLKTLKGYDLGMVFGVLSHMSETFRLDLRFDLGLRNVIDQRPGYGPDGGALRTRALSLGLEYVF